MEKAMSSKDDFDKSASIKPPLDPNSILMAASQLKKRPKKVTRYMMPTPNGTKFVTAKTRQKVLKAPMVNMERLRAMQEKKIEFKRAQRPNLSQMFNLRR
jgi:hypothetical protein